MSVDFAILRVHPRFVIRKCREKNSNARLWRWLISSRKCLSRSSDGNSFGVLYAFGGLIWERCLPAPGLRALNWTGIEAALDPGEPAVDIAEQNLGCVPGCADQDTAPLFNNAAPGYERKRVRQSLYRPRKHHWRVIALAAGRGFTPENAERPPRGRTIAPDR
jgi:hypothetical protein